MKKLILLGFILAVGVVRIPAVEAASYPTGQATVTLVTPFNGIPKYSGVGQTYVNEWASRAGWGYPMDDVKWTTKATVGAINATTGTVATKTAALVVAKAASASIVGVAVQAGLMVGAVYFGEWLEQEVLSWFQDPVTGQYYLGDPTNMELPEGCPAGGTVCWNGETLAYGATVGTMYAAYGNPATQISIVEGIFRSNAEVTAACPSCWSQATYYLTGWYGFGNKSYNTGTGTVEDPLVRHYYYYSQYTQPNLVDISTLGVPAPLTPAEMEARIQAAFDSNNPERMTTAMEMSQGALAAVAPYVNESNKDFPVSRNTAPEGTPTLTPTQISTVQDALDDSIDPTDEEEVEGQESTSSGDTDWEYTPQEMAKAQYDMDKQLDRERKAEYDAQGVTELGDPPVPEAPEKDSITTRLGDFYDAIGNQSSGILGLLEDSKTTNFSGACSVAFDLEEWGEQEFSLCEWETPFRALGDIMVIMCTFGWLLWFFKGRGEG